eukprot:scaffold23850_cov145-Amphora_coffeaeformis.AAC.1
MLYGPLPVPHPTVVAVDCCFQLLFATIPHHAWLQTWCAHETIFWEHEVMTHDCNIYYLSMVFGEKRQMVPVVGSWNGAVGLLLCPGKKGGAPGLYHTPYCTVLFSLSS